ELEDQQDWLINPVTVLQFDRELIGPAGRAGLAVQPAGVREALRELAPAITVNAGSAIAPDREIVAVDKTALADAGLADGVRGLNVVGGSGSNTAMLKNMTGLKGL